MSAALPRPASLSWSEQLEIDALCDQFESELNHRPETRIEDFIAAATHPVPAQLLFELAAVECEIRRNRGEDVDLSAYKARFPGADHRFLLPAIEYPFPQSQDVTPSETDPPADTVKSPQTRATLKHFELLEVVGRGGFGTVWRSVDTRLEREVAVKVPRVEQLSPAGRFEFLREARAAANLRHPNIVAVHEISEDGGVLFIVTDFIDGPSLREQLRSRRFAHRNAAELVSALAGAVDYAHQRGIVHRDLKPANVLIDLEGKPYITDFGMAQRTAEKDNRDLNGWLAGTPLYMAPEQARGDYLKTDPRTDVYALGVILYEILCGTTPHRGGQLPELLHRINHESPAPPRSIDPDIPPELEAIALKSLAKEPGARFQSAREMGEAIGRFIARPSTEGTTASAASINRRVWLGGVAAGAIALPLAIFTATRRHQVVAEPETCWVEMTTDPGGCEITAVKINEETGEPDARHITTAVGRTPLRMGLAPGDYLIVAVLNESRFHEAAVANLKRNRGSDNEPGELVWKKTSLGRSNG